MKRVLQVFGEPLDNGGQEAFIMNMYRNIDREKVQFDFFTPYYCANESLRQEIESMGGRVFEKVGRFDGQGNKGDFLKNLSAFFEEHQYDTVHIHSGSIFSLAFGARLAKKSGAKKVFVHSHATGYDNLQYRVIRAISPFIFKGNATHYLACSKMAAEWKFPASVIRSGNYCIINNGIDAEKFRFSQEIREQYRQTLGLENHFAVCHIGRFSEEKNHRFLLEVFARIQKTLPGARLLLIGDGPLKQEIQQLSKELSIASKVSFLGIRKDVSEILQAADLFLFPSLFEGLGIVAIEAQCTGLSVLASEQIPDEAAVTPYFHKLSLEEGAEKWAKEALSLIPAKDRAACALSVAKGGFSSTHAAATLQKLYLED